MMDLATIRELSRESGALARQENKRPFCIECLEDISQYPPFPFPNLGDYCPAGYAEVDRWFCDSSGFGTDHEPALTPARLRDKLRTTYLHHPEYSYGIVETGQFQLYLGVFRRVGA